MKKSPFFIWARALRVQQWIKNTVVYTSLVFSGKLFSIDLFLKATDVFLIFCALSSVSYLLNDIIDKKSDELHPRKKHRPIASGLITIPQATFVAFLLALGALLFALIISPWIFFVSLLFLLLHLGYTFYLKHIALIDIFAIALSFVIRALAGELVTGYHIPIWLLLTIGFLSLFMATVKRRAEFTYVGKESRKSLKGYSNDLLSFMTNTFATATFFSYTVFAYYERPPAGKTFFSDIIQSFYPEYEGRKLLMITIPFVIYAVLRYAQVFFAEQKGEEPERIVTHDRPLLITLFLWAATVIALVYIF